MSKTLHDTDVKRMQSKGKLSSLQKYAQIAVGSTSLLQLIRYELIYLICVGLPGIIGFAARRLLYPFIFSSMGKGSTLGRNVSIRGATKIKIGKNVLIDDNCTLDARGETTEIVIGDNVIISGGTTIRARNAQLTIGKGCSIGRNCLLGTDRSLFLGEEVLLGAYTYLCAGGLHRFDMPEASVISQGILESKGIVVADGAWLGTRVTVLDGVTIGRGSVVGAHSLVNRDLPELIIAHGSPARIQRKRNE